MPIKPSNRHLYPPDWKAIRAKILSRAGERCERCDKPNHVTVAVLSGGYWYDVERGLWRGDDGREVGTDYNGPETERRVYVVLTVAHLDHDPRNNDESNLACYCQACHLAHDAEIHRAHAAVTRREKRAVYQPALLEVL